MPAGRYSAGRIFLQVVPSFKGFQREVDREVKKANAGMAKSLEDEAGKGGRRAGRKAGGEFLMGFSEWTSGDQKRLQQSFGRMLVDLDKMQRKQIDEAESWAQKSAERLRRQRERDLKDAEKWAQKGAESMRKQRVQDAREEAAAAERSRAAAAKRHQALVAEAEKSAKVLRRIRERENAAEEAAMRKSMARRGGLARQEIEKAIRGIDESIGELGFGRKIDGELEHVRRKAKDVQKDLSDGLIDTTKARAQVEALGRSLRKIQRSNPGLATEDRGNIRAAIADIDRMGNALDRTGKRGSAFSRFLRGATDDGQDGANAFRIFNYRVLAVAMSLPLLAPVLAVAAAGIVALGTAALGAAAGLGVMVLGFSGVFAAVKALGDVADNSAKDNLAASKTMRNAARGVRDAQQSLAQARVQAARAAEDSSRRIASAEKRLADAQRDATQAQENLRLARKRAQDDQEALADRIKAGQLDERQGLIDLFNAQVAYNSVMASGGSTNLEKEQASIDLERAQLAMRGIRRDNKAMAAEQAKYAKQGADGTEAVQSALESQRRATEAVADAEQDVADARRDAARQAADSARAIRDAQERVTDAQEAYNEALTQTGEIGSGSMQKLEQAMGKLSPAGRAFALYLHGLRDDFYALRAVAQEGLLPGVQESMDILFKRYGPGFSDFVGKMAKGLGDFFVYVSKVLTSPVWEDFFAMMDRNGPAFATGFGKIFLDLATGLAALMTAFEPFTLDFMEGLAGVAKSFADWSASLGESEGFQRFLAYLEVTGPKVWEFFKSFGAALVAVGIAIAPVADFLLDFFITVFEFIANMDPDTLAAIVTGIIGFVLASQAAAGATQLLITLMTPFHSLLGAIVFIIIAVGAALVYAYQHNEEFRDSVNRVFNWIRENKDMLLQMAGFIGLVAGGFLLVTKVLIPLWQGLQLAWTIIKNVRLALMLLGGPVSLIIGAIVLLGLALIWLWNNNETFRENVIAAWEWIQQAAIYMWENVLKPVFEAIGAIIGWLWNNIIKPYFTFMFGVYRTLAEIVLWVWGVIGPVFELFGAVVRALWDNVIGPVFGWIGDRFSDLATLINDVWVNYIEPVLDRFGLGADDLSRMWGTAIEAIGNLWHNLIELIKTPLRFIVDTIINRGFVDNFNRLADYFGTSHIKHLSLSFLDGPAPKKAPASVNGQRVNAGQFYTGGYTGPGAKYQPAGVVHADEYVIKKESTNRLRRKYGLGALDYINTYGELPGMGGYATGGLVAFGKLLQRKGFSVSEHPAFGGVHGGHMRGSEHYRGRAIDVNWPNGMRQSAEETAKINAIVGLARQYGLRTLWQWKGHYDHAHFDLAAGRDLGNFAGAGGGRSGDLPWWIEKPYEFLKDKVEGLFSGIPNTGIGGLLKGLPVKVLEFAKEKISDLINGSGDFDDTGNGEGFSSAVMQWRDEVQAALRLVGQPASLTDTVLRRLQQESGGNPKAINRWDSNFLGGTPSKGLMQVIDPTFRTWRDPRLSGNIYDPMANIVASMRYAINRYGSLKAAYDREGGYAEGGLVTEGGSGIPDNGTMMYDNGGYLPPGITQVVNLTGRPEPVFTASQFEAMGSGGRGPGGAPLIGQYHQHGSDLTASDVAGEIMFAVKRAEHGGKFAGRSN